MTADCRRCASPRWRSTFSRTPYKYSMPTFTRSTGFQISIDRISFSKRTTQASPRTYKTSRCPVSTASATVHEHTSCVRLHHIRIASGHAVKVSKRGGRSCIPSRSVELLNRNSRTPERPSKRAGCHRFAQRLVSHRHNALRNGCSCTDSHCR